VPDVLGGHVLLPEFLDAMSGAHSLSALGSYARTQCICDACYTKDAEGCTACAVRTHKALGGSMACAVCAEGTYAPGTASVTCAPCPANTVSDAGSWELAACVAREGAYGAPENEAELCAEGFYANQRNLSGCVPWVDILLSWVRETWRGGRDGGAGRSVGVPERVNAICVRVFSSVSHL
jgi:hypothetical protein